MFTIFDYSLILIYVHCSFLLFQHIPMSSSIFSSSGHSIYTQKHIDLCFFGPAHTEIIIIYQFRTSYWKAPSSDHESHSRSDMAICTFLIFWLTFHVYILLFSLIYAETIPPLSPAILLDSRHQSVLPHIFVIFHSKHSHSFLINIPKP